MRKILCILCLFCLGFLQGQLKHPKASPLASLTQEVGLSKISVTYSRPSVRGRTIFGDIVPYGRIWRVGANASTKFTVDTDVEILGNVLPKGTYALYAFPEEKQWEIVFHTNTSHWGDGRKAYDSKEDAFRITIVPEQMPILQENFLISFDAITHNKLAMLWIWEHTKITIPIQVPTDSKMMQEIATQLKENPSAQTYYEAARYLQEQQKEYATALNYLNQAIALGGDTYYFYRVKSLVEAALGQYKNAIESADTSLKLAKKEGKDEFVRMNEKNIKQWKLQSNTPKK